MERPLTRERVAPLAMAAGEVEVVERRDSGSARELLQGRQPLEIVLHRVGGCQLRQRLAERVEPATWSGPP